MDDDLRVEHARSFDMLLHLGVQADATAWANGTTEDEARKRCPFPRILSRRPRLSK